MLITSLNLIFPRPTSPLKDYRTVAIRTNEMSRCTRISKLNVVFRPFTALTALITVITSINLLEMINCSSMTHMKILKWPSGIINHLGGFRMKEDSAGIRGKRRTIFNRKLCPSTFYNTYNL